MRALISLALVSGCGSSADPPSVDCSPLASASFEKAADHDFWTCQAAHWTDADVACIGAAKTPDDRQRCKVGAVTESAAPPAPVLAPPSCKQFADFLDRWLACIPPRTAPSEGIGKLGDIIIDGLRLDRRTLGIALSTATRSTPASLRYEESSCARKLADREWHDTCMMMGFDAAQLATCCR